MDLNLLGKSALVTGASQGIGKACALELALLGCRVIVAARGELKLKAVVDELERIAPNGHSYLVIDTGEHDAMRKAVEKELKQRGPIEILINNTGGPSGGPVCDAQKEQFEEALNSHLHAAVLLSQLCIPGMKEKRYGRILNILSSSVKTPIPLLGVSNTVRWAVAAWAKTLSREVGPFGITVNCILPGTIDTDRLKETTELKAREQKKSIEEIKEEKIKDIPLKRIADPREIGAVAAFLATPAGSYVSGAAIPVDGGLLPCY